MQEGQLCATCSHEWKSWEYGIWTSYSKILVHFIIMQVKQQKA